MRFPDWLTVYGDRDYRGPCREEDAEQVDFVAWVQQWYPQYGFLLLHPKIEGKRTPQQARRDRLSGAMNKGASDIIIPGSPSFVCELKRLDHTKSRWQTGQLEYLEAAKSAGSFFCVALGAEAAKVAFIDYIEKAGDRS